MAYTTLGIGDLAAESGLGNFIQTMALGSCIAVILHDHAGRAGGMAHVALPDSKLAPEKARELPGYFADTAVAVLMQRIARKAGLARAKPVVKLVGGANMLHTHNTFNIGRRNLAALQQALELQGLGVYQSDVGGNFSRNVSLDVHSGHVRVWSPGIGAWSV